MASISIGQKAGKSLLKFFRPIRVGNLNYDPQNSSSNKKGFKVLKFKKTEPAAPEEKKAFFLNEEETISYEVIPPPQDGEWLGVVEHLLSVCKKVSHKMAKNSGVRAYKSVQGTGMKQKIKVIGSIINLTSQGEFDLPPEAKKVVEKAEKTEKVETVEKTAKKEKKAA